MPFNLNFDGGGDDSHKGKHKQKKDKKDKKGKKDKKDKKHKKKHQSQNDFAKKRKHKWEADTESSGSTSNSELDEPVQKRHKVLHKEEDQLGQLLQNAAQTIRHSKSDPKKDVSEFTYSAGLHHDIEAAKIEIKGQGKKSIIDYKKMAANKKAKDCFFCPESDTFKKDLRLSIGVTMYLALPSKGVLSTGHCLIIPMEHKGSQVEFEQAELDELRNFKKCLTAMLSKQCQTPVFLETVMHVNKNRHTIIECVPIPNDEFADAEMTFSIELRESEMEFRTDQTTKPILRFGKDGPKGAVPADFPYFAVSFGLEGGLAHIIADEETWNPNFGREVAGGLSGNVLGGRVVKASRNITEIKKELPVFLKMWEPFDWTAQLEGGAY